MTERGTCRITSELERGKDKTVHEFVGDTHELHNYIIDEGLKTCARSLRQGINDGEYRRKE